MGQTQGGSAGNLELLRKIDKLKNLTFYQNMVSGFTGLKEGEIATVPLEVSEPGFYLVVFNFAPCGTPDGLYQAKIKRDNGTYVNMGGRNYFNIPVLNAGWDGFYSAIGIGRLEKHTYTVEFINVAGGTSVQYDSAFGIFAVKISD